MDPRRLSTLMIWMQTKVTNITEFSFNIHSIIVWNERWEFAEDISKTAVEWIRAVSFKSVGERKIIGGKGSNSELPYPYLKYYNNAWGWIWNLTGGGGGLIIFRYSPITLLNGTALKRFYMWGIVNGTTRRRITEVLTVPATCDGLRP